MTDRRKPLTGKQKAAIIAAQGGVCPGLPHLRITCGKEITPQTCTFDHFEQRTFTKSDDVGEFQALCRGPGSCDDIKTNGPGGLIRATTAGSDSHKRAKVRRTRKWMAGFTETVKNRVCGQKRKPTGNFPTGRKMQSRNTFGRKPDGR